MAAADLIDLRDAVWLANQALVRAGLVTLSFGNASGIDRAAGIMVIKPSGVPYEELLPEHLVAVALDDGRVLGGELRPSSDTPTHLALYRHHAELGGVVHTHSTAATAWAQAGRSIPPLGTTHADHFHGAVPVSRQLTLPRAAGDAEAETGAAIVETLVAARPKPPPRCQRRFGPVAPAPPSRWGRTRRRGWMNDTVALLGWWPPWPPRRFP